MAYWESLLRNHRVCGDGSHLCGRRTPWNLARLIRLQWRKLWWGRWWQLSGHQNDVGNAWCQNEYRGKGEKQGLGVDADCWRFQKKLEKGSLGKKFSILIHKRTHAQVVPSNSGRNNLACIWGKSARRRSPCWSPGSFHFWLESVFTFKMLCGRRLPFN